MADPSSVITISLPQAVEQMLQKICADQNQSPPTHDARRRLASLSEEESLDLLRKISARRIRSTLTGFIIFMAKKASSPSPSPPVSPINRPYPFPASGSPSTSSLMNSQDREGAASNSPNRQHLIGSPSSSSDRAATRQSFSLQLEALGELEFRKAFLILSYIGRNKLEDVTSADEIRRLKDMPMGTFEMEVWRAFGQKCINGEDRLESIGWDSGKTYHYHCHVSADGSYTLKGPYLNKTRTHLQRVLGDDSVLNVKFEDKGTDGSSLAMYSKIAKEGLLIGLRCYRFFVFKDGRKEEKKKDPTTSPVKCFFVCMESNASYDYNKLNILYKKKTVHEARCLFMHAHTVPSVAKYMFRFSLILSKTIKLELDLAALHIQRIEDIPCLDEKGNKVGELIHTDGTGFISEDLALKCPQNLFKRKHYINTLNFEKFLGNVELKENGSELRRSESKVWEPPLLIQCRLFNNGCAVKGTLLVNRKLPPGTIQIRDSMIKVETDSSLSDTQTVNSLEIVGTSNRPKKTHLSRNLIALLSYGGVPKGYFMDILMNALEDVQSARLNRRAALTVSLDHGEMDDFIAARMILSGIPLDEPFLQHHLPFLMNEEKKGLKGGKIPVSDCYNLMGTADPTGLLKSDEVCIILDNGQISGKVLVYRHPGCHFGDIHVLNATYVKAMEDFVGNSKYAIFFPTRGCRSLADEMASGDFDGDTYFVTRNPQLLETYKASDPWIPTYSIPKMPETKRPNKFSDLEDLEHELFQLFLTTRFQPSITMGAAFNSGLVLMDRLLILGDDSADEKDCVKKKLLKLIDIYYYALDAPKSGMKVEVPEDLKAKKYPHFMEKKNNYSYKSTSILGEIFDAVESFGKGNVQEIVVWRLPCFDVEVPQECLRLWKQRYDEYRCEMFAALHDAKESKNKSADGVIKKYKQLLYHAADFEESIRDKEVIFNEALAIYQVTYDYAESKEAQSKEAKCKEDEIKEPVSYCNFAWKVAGSALCMLYAMKQNEKLIVCSPSVLREILS